MVSRSIADVSGLRATSPAFKRGLIELADRLDLNVSYLAAVIAAESHFDPAALNPTTKAAGLIQFLPSTAKQYGTSTAELLQMTAEEQLPFVEKRYARFSGLHTPEDHYMAVFAPACVGFEPSSLLPCALALKTWRRPEGGCTSPPKGPYCQNAALDQNDDGMITVAEASLPVHKLLEQAASRPPLVVDMDPKALPVATSEATVGSKLAPMLAGMAVGLGAVWVVSRFSGRLH